MHPVIENILDRPLGQKIGIWVGTLVVISYGFYQFGYGGLATELSTAQEQKDKLSAQVSNEQRLAKNLPKVREEVKLLDQKLNQALQELPDKREIPDLLSNISNLARDAGLEVSLFKPKDEVFKEFYAEVPVNISVSGSYHQVATFFDEVGRLPRVVNIGQIQIRDPLVTETHVAIKADCVATTFRYLDESERTQTGDESADKRRRK